MTPEARATYIVSCIREAGCMYPQDAAAFLAEHDAHRRDQVLREAGGVADELIAAVPRTDPDAFARVDSFRAYSDRLHEIADSGTPPAGESTRPVPPVQVWHVFDEDTTQPLPPLFTTKASAELGTIDRYQAAGEYSPDYSWRPHEDGSHELLAGGDPVGIYLTSVTVNGDTATAPDFFQPGRTYTDAEFPEYGWQFRCDTVTTHPEDGDRTALGWRYFHGTWDPYAYGEDDWDVQKFVGFAVAPEGEVPRG